MKFIKFYFIIGISIVLSVGSVYLLNTNQIDQITYFQPININEVSAQIIPESEFDATPCFDVDAQRIQTAVEFELPHTLPSNFKLKHIEKHPVVDVVTLSYSFGNECDGIQPFSDGALEIRSSMRPATFDEIEFENATKSRLLSLPRNDHYEFFEINGNFAWGYESGIVEDRYMHPNGTVFDTQKVVYPGRVSFIGSDVDTYHVIRGYYVLDDLKMMAESFR